MQCPPNSVTPSVNIGKCTNITSQSPLQLAAGTPPLFPDLPFRGKLPLRHRYIQPFQPCLLLPHLQSSRIGLTLNYDRLAAQPLRVLSTKRSF